MKRDLTDMAGWSGWLGEAPPRLLQGHSPSGELHCTDLVEKRRDSGESLVNNSGLDQPRLTWDAEIDRKANSLSCHTGIPESIRQSLLCSRPGRPPSLNPVAENHQEHHKPEPQFRWIGIQQHDQQNKLRNQPGKFLTKQGTQCHEQSEHQRGVPGCRRNGRSQKRSMRKVRKPPVMERSPGRT